LFDHRFGLYKLNSNGTTIQTNSAVKIVPNQLKFIELSGIILAKAIQEECIVDVNFTKSFLKNLLHREIRLDDLDDIDAQLTKNLRWILQNNVEGLDLPFTHETEIFGQNVIGELIPGGSDIVLTESNKKDFVKKVCEKVMRNEIEEEIKAFIRGFNLIFPLDWLELFSPSELSLLIGGIPEINADELKEYAKLEGLSKDSELVKWLFEIIGEFSQKELAALVFFMSGSIKLPYGGFKEKPLRFNRSSYSTTQLPLAHTCSYAMDVPEYKSKEEMKQKILLAIFEGQGSFEMG
jgi:E3 ubiquitin-protein ligase HUWE1